MPLIIPISSIYIEPDTLQINTFKQKSIPVSTSVMKVVSDFILVQLKSILMDSEQIGWRGWKYVNEAIDKYCNKNKK